MVESQKKQKLSEEARKKRNEYMRNWRKAHPERVAEYNRRKWERYAEKSQDAAEAAEG